MVAVIVDSLITLCAIDTDAQFMARLLLQAVLHETHVVFCAISSNKVDIDISNGLLHLNTLGTLLCNSIMFSKVSQCFAA